MLQSRRNCFACRICQYNVRQFQIGIAICATSKSNFEQDAVAADRLVLLRHLRNRIIDLAIAELVLRYKVRRWKSTRFDLRYLKYSLIIRQMNFRASQVIDIFDADIHHNSRARIDGASWRIYFDDCSALCVDGCAYQHTK